MDRKDQRHARGNGNELVDQARKRPGIVYVRGTVQRRNAKAVDLKAKICGSPLRLNFLSQQLQRVDHDVADTADLFRANSLTGKIVVCIRRWGPQYVGQEIGNDAVDL